LALPSWKAHFAFIAVLLNALAITPRSGIAQVPVELELILAVDASGSVSASEFDLAVQGLAAAFRDSEVIAAIRDAGPAGIAVALMQWSSPGQQLMAVDWSVVSDSTSAESLAKKIIAAGRLILGETAIDAALRFATAELAGNPYSGQRRIIDLSGDGTTNWGASPDRARDQAVAAGITINGLAVANEQPELGRYYRDHVIGGDGAFVITAADYEDFRRAIRLKLIHEIGGRPAARLNRTKGEKRWKVGAIARRSF
jgi:hypothetical protein